MFTLSFIKPSFNNVSIIKINSSNTNSFSLTPVEDCIVDFGDGQRQTYKGTGSQISINHNYDTEKEYTITITGNHSHFRAPIRATEAIQLSDTITSCENMFNSCIFLTNIAEGFKIPNSVTNCSSMFAAAGFTNIPTSLTIPDSVTNCSDMFYDCTNLTIIPETFKIGNSVTNCSNMFMYTFFKTLPSNFIIPNSVTDCHGMFNESFITDISNTNLTIPDSVINCSGMFGFSQLTKLSNNFKLSKSATNMAGMFKNCSLQHDISNIWPDFTSNSTIDISEMFFYEYGFNSVTGIIPADKLWNSGKTFNSAGCFKSCTSLTNYADIPAGWK